MGSTTPERGIRIAIDVSLICFYVDLYCSALLASMKRVWRADSITDRLVCSLKSCEYPITTLLLYLQLERLQLKSIISAGEHSLIASATPALAVWKTMSS